MFILEFSVAQLTTSVNMDPPPQGYQGVIDLGALRLKTREPPRWSLRRPAHD
jgi:hypothetical protein